MADEKQYGEMPTTGAARPGPTYLAVTTYTPRPTGVRPIAIRIPSIQVDSEIERRPIKDGQMLDPTGPFVVAWYGSTGRLGEPGNIVLAGHVDFADVGPAVFARAAELTEGDRIELTGEDVNVYRYGVVWSQMFDETTAPVEEIIGPTPKESVTLITCGGEFNANTQRYLQRLVIRAERLT
jgi:LPXTG-site transpeptidase (sortase) family protein